MSKAKDFLDSVRVYAQPPAGTRAGAQDRPPKMGVVDPAYGGTGPAKVQFDGEAALSTKAYVTVNCTIAASDRVVLLPLGKTLGIFGTINGGGTTALAAVVAALGPKVTRLIVHDQKTANTASGTLTSGAFAKRDLTTVILNTITGATLTSNVISLPAGTYVVHGSAPAYFVNQHKAKLRDTTNSVDLVNGTSEYSSSVLADGFPTRSFIEGSFTLAGTTNIELQHRVATTRATNGGGVASNFGVPEVYSVLTIEKVA